MIQNKFVSSPYKLDPDSVKFDPIVDFNKEKTIKNYDSLLRGIKLNGQIEPIYIKNGLCGDGRHRVKICKELNIKVLAIDVNPNMDKKEYLEMCNKNTFTSRNDTATQLAIKGYKMMKEYGYEQNEAEAALGIKDNKIIGRVRFIADTRFSSVLDTLLEGKSVNIDGKWSKSVDVVKRRIASILKQEEEDRNGKNEETNIPVIDYNEYINNPIGEEIFWRILGNNSTISMDNKMEMIGIINKVYK